MSIKDKIKKLNLDGIKAVTIKKGGVSEFSMTLTIKFKDSRKNVSFHAPRDGSEQELLDIQNNFQNL